MTSLRGVLLDIDGTLVDSNDAHAMAWVEALEKEGHTVAFEPVRKAIGMGGDKLLPQVVGVAADSDVGKRASRLRGQIFQARYLPSLRPFARVRELLERIVGAGLRVVLATSAQPDEVQALLRIADVDDLVKIAADKSAVNHSKPSPDVVQVALAKVGLAPHEAVMIGDTPYDVTASRRAGVRVIALRCGGHPDSSLAEADNIFDDVADLLRNVDRSVLAPALGSTGR